MPVPRYCPNRDCPNHYLPTRSWRISFGSYHTVAHGQVRRYRCRLCGTTVSDQTESIHYFAKRRLPLQAVAASLLGGSSMREVARRYGVSVMAVQNGVLRLGRQSMAAQVRLLSKLNERPEVAFDGLRSFVGSQDYPCDITTTVDSGSETILTMTHAVFRRGGRMTPVQKQRLAVKNKRWKPKAGTVKAAIALHINELWDYLRPEWPSQVTIHTDDNPIYASVLQSDAILRHFATVELAAHKTTPSTAPRTFRNRLFPVNYVDRLLRHRMKEHTRESIAFGRHAVMQMHRAWVFAWDHNCRREHRVKRPEEGVHATHGCVDQETVRMLTRGFFERRIRLRGCAIPESIRQVWTGELQTPPLRWRIGQKHSSIRISRFAVRDLEEAYQHASRYY